jgi:hypothetical protein
MYQDFAFVAVYTALTFGESTMQFLSRRTMLAMLCAAMMLTACGQKGDLYLPEGQAETVMVG